MSAPLELLLVDDDPIDRRAIQRAFRQTSIPVKLTEAETLSSAKAALASASFDCVLLDVSLPGGSGMELLSLAKKTPVIFLTGHDDADLAERALQQGAQDYLLKDEIRPRALGRAILFAIERKRAEQMLTNLQHTERLSALGQMAASVAHEINNPCAIAQANLHALKELLEIHAGELPDHLSKEMQEIVDEGLAGIERVTGIVRKLNVFSREDHHPHEPLSLNALVEQACDLVENEAKHRARLELELSEADPKINGSRADLVQVLTSLLLNGVQALQGDQADNLIRILTETSGGRARVVVEDTGAGIPEVLRERVLDPFFTTKPVGTGTGLGLSISKELLLRHGGELRLEARSTRGTRVTVELPLYRERARLASAQPKRILLIDDEPRLLRAYQRLLRPHETVCGDGRFAMELLPNDSSFDLVLCDLMMPKIDGPQLYEAVEAVAPHLLGRLYFYSGGVFTERMERFVRGLKTPLLEKPLSKRELLDLLERGE